MGAVLDRIARPSLLADDLRAETNPEQKKITVFGLTLYAAWNQLRPWILDSDTRGWTINLLCLSPPSTTGRFAGLVDPKWKVDAADRIAEIEAFISTYSADLSSRNVSLSLKQYDSFPAVHGFLFGSGKIYMSYTQWSNVTHLLDYGPHPYEVVEATDKSLRADSYRKLFYNWLSRAKQPLTSVNNAQ